MEEDREEFEKWKKARSMSVDITIRDSNGDYQYLETRRDWYVWWNAIATRQPEIDALTAELEGKKRVIETMRSVERLLRRDIEEQFNENASLKAQVERLWNALQSPESIIALIGSNFSSKSKSLDGDLASVKYVLTAHDLISAFSSLFDDATEAK
jgi:hypothetical protein